MKLTNKEKLKVKQFAKKLVEGSFQINQYNFNSGIDSKKLEKVFNVLTTQLQTGLDDIENNMGTKPLIYTKFQSLLFKLGKIKDECMIIIKDYEKESKGGSYLSSVTDPDTLSKIDTITKRK